MTQIRKIGILTGGGDCPGLNAVIRAVVRCAEHQYGWQSVGFRDGYRGLVLNDYLPLSFDSVAGLLDRGGTILGSSNRDNPFAFPVATPQGEQLRDMSGQVAENLRREGIDALVIIGGDGTMTAAELFSRQGLTVIGVPKTIDNDLIGTDYTFGFHTAVETASEAIDKIHSTAESHHRLMAVEVMGRYAGWIALHAGMSSGADIILIPELPYDLDAMAATISRRAAAGKHFSIIVVSEGVRHPNGHLVSRQLVAGSPDPLRLGGVSAVIAAELEARCGIEARSVVLGHLQRGGRPNPFDRILATRFGAAAVEELAQGSSGCMVALQGADIVTIPLAAVAGRQKLVPADHELLRIGREIGVCFGS